MTTPTDPTTTANRMPLSELTTRLRTLPIAQKDRDGLIRFQPYTAQMRYLEQIERIRGTGDPLREVWLEARAWGLLTLLAARSFVLSPQQEYDYRAVVFVMDTPDGARLMRQMFERFVMLKPFPLESTLPPMAFNVRGTAQGFEVQHAFGVQTSFQFLTCDEAQADTVKVRPHTVVLSGADRFGFDPVSLWKKYDDYQPSELFLCGMGGDNHDPGGLAFNTAWVHAKRYGRDRKPPILARFLPWWEAFPNVGLGFLTELVTAPDYAERHLLTRCRVKPDMIHWRRKRIQELGEARFLQEYPESAEAIVGDFNQYDSGSALLVF